MLDVVPRADGTGGRRSASLADESSRSSPDRRGEVLDLSRETVDRARGVILLDVRKSGKRREVPLNSRADAVLARCEPARSDTALPTSDSAQETRVEEALLSK